MKTKKRRKSSRFRGSHTHGRGFKKKARGSGHRGGKGLAGTGKRADQKKTLILNLYGNDYFGSDKALRKKQSIKLEVINLRQITENLPTYIKTKKAAESKDAIETSRFGFMQSSNLDGAQEPEHAPNFSPRVLDIDLKGYKILGEGEITKKLKITASAASKSAMEKVRKSGGEIIIHK